MVSVELNLTGEIDHDVLIPERHHLLLDPVKVRLGHLHAVDQPAVRPKVLRGHRLLNVHKVANVDDLEWAVARNVAHELLHAFNVGHHDTSGTYLDAAVANWDMLLSPDTKFSEDAVADLRTQIAAGIPESATSAIGSFGQHIAASSTCAHCIAAQRIDVQPVPEPATIAMWTVGVALAFVAHRKRQARIA